MNDPEVFKNPCPICKKRVANKLCDFVTDYVWTSSDFKLQHLTCDLPICSECASNHGPFDFCPHHEEVYKQIQLPKKLRMIALRNKAEEFWGEDKK